MAVMGLVLRWGMLVGYGGKGPIVSVFSVIHSMLFLLCFW